MSLKDRLMADLKQAMRAKDSVRRGTIRMIRSAVKYVEIDLQREATDEEIVEIIGREVKHRKEAIDLFRQGNRDDLVKERQAEIAILEEYLPEQLSEQGIETVLREIVADLDVQSPDQLGPVMREAMQRLKGRADGALVNQIAREILSE